MMTNSNHSIVFTPTEKFCGKRFPNWQTKMQLLLIRDNIWELVSGEDEIPSSNQPEHKAWKQCNHKGISIIGLGLADTWIHHVDFKLTAHQI